MEGNIILQVLFKQKKKIGVCFFFLIIKVIFKHKGYNNNKQL